MRDFLNAYLPAVARRGYSIVAGGLVTIASWLADFARVPVWAWAVAGVLVAQAWAWNDLRKEWVTATAKIDDLTRPVHFPRSAITFRTYIGRDVPD